MCHNGTMNLNPYTETLREQLAIAAETGGDEARALADRLTAPLESASRLVLLEVLSAAADEITREMAPSAVEVRLRGGEPEFVVISSPADEMFDHVPTRVAPPIERATEDDGGTSRLNLRLPEGLKARIEEAARNEGLSLNAWLVRAATSALTTGQHPSRRTPSGGDRYTGWLR